jgi:hypothetical protein
MIKPSTTYGMPCGRNAKRIYEMVCLFLVPSQRRLVVYGHYLVHVAGASGKPEEYGCTADGLKEHAALLRTWQHSANPLGNATSEAKAPVISYTKTSSGATIATFGGPGSATVPPTPAIQPFSSTGNVLGTLQGKPSTAGYATGYTTHSGLNGGGAGRRAGGDSSTSGFKRTRAGETKVSDPHRNAIIAARKRAGLPIPPSLLSGSHSDIVSIDDEYDSMMPDMSSLSLARGSMFTLAAIAARKRAQQQAASAAATKGKDANNKAHRGAGGAGGKGTQPQREVSLVDLSADDLLVDGEFIDLTEEEMLDAEESGCGTCGDYTHVHEEEEVDIYDIEGDIPEKESSKGWSSSGMSSRKGDAWVEDDEDFIDLLSPPHPSPRPSPHSAPSPPAVTSSSPRVPDSPHSQDTEPDVNHP